MSIQRNDSLFFAAPKSGDSRYDNDGAGYANVSAVNVAIISSYRFIGLTVNVQGVEYWYRDGILDGDLIEKELGNSLQNISDSSGNNLLVGGNNSGSVTLTGNSSDTNADFIVVPQGTGTFKLGGNHQANITDDDDVITKGFADANYSSSVSAAGANTQVQFNNAGSFGASSNLTFASDTLTVNGTDVGDGLIEMSNASINLILASNLNSYAAFGVSSSQALDYTEGAYFKADGVTLGGDAIIAAGEGADVIVFTENTERLRILTNGNATVNGVWDFQANVISNVANPSSDQDAATKNYVDGLVVGFEVTTNKGAANGYTPLDANSKVSVTYLDVFDSSDSGIVPGSGGGTTNFLRADGTWAAPTGSITESTYVPTITSINNVDSALVNGTIYYWRIGDTVFVQGSLNVDHTANARTELDIDLPIASNLVNGTLIGQGNIDTNTNMESIDITSNTTDDRAKLEWYYNTGPLGGFIPISFSFHYRVL